MIAKCHKTNKQTNKTGSVKLKFIAHWYIIITHVLSYNNVICNTKISAVQWNINTSDSTNDLEKALSSGSSWSESWALFWHWNFPAKCHKKVKPEQPIKEWRKSTLCWIGQDKIAGSRPPTERSYGFMWSHVGWQQEQEWALARESEIRWE